MRILFLASWFPYPPDNGSRQRTRALLRGLRAHQITLIALTDPDQTVTRVPELDALCENIIALPRKSFAPRRLSALRAFFSTQPRYLRATYDAAVSAAIRQTLDANKYDAVVASELSMARYAAEINASNLVFDDLEIGIFRDAYVNARGWARRRNYLTWVKFKHLVQNLAKYFRLVTAVSEVERAHALALGLASTQIAIVPNGVDCDAADLIAASVEPLSLIYNGALAFAPNRDAAQYFVREILPLVRAQEPAAHLRITGRANQVAQNELSADNIVSFTGYVAEVKPLVKASAICVVPLRQGGGTRLKILEAMALRTPIVSTSKGAEGLSVRHGEHLLLADTPRAFADAILKLFRNEPLRQSLTDNAYALARAKYDWTLIGEHFNQLLLKCAPQDLC